MRFFTHKKSVSFRLDVDTFYVYEIDSRGIIVDDNYKISDPGDHNIYILKKSNWATDNAIMEIAKNNNLRFRDIGFAGMKDKRATTYQRISSQKPLTIKLKDISLILAGKGSRISMGDLWGNMFRVYTGADTAKIAQGIRDTSGKFMNYFGSQRFGRNGINLRVGIALLQGRMSEALDLYLYEPREGSDIRQNEFPKYLKHERMISQLRSKYDDIRVWKMLPRNFSLMFIHSVQSYIFNQELDIRIDMNDYADKLNLVGWDTELNKYERDILDGLNIEQEMFRMKNLRFLNARGSTRSMFVTPKDLNIYDSYIEFSLPSGSYATVFLDQMVGDMYLNQYISI
ncbi:MAG: tRNA pseudouridine(13) synthase TruD [Candidatus Anstonellales archaeon]